MKFNFKKPGLRGPALIYVLLMLILLSSLGGYFLVSSPLDARVLQVCEMVYSRHYWSKEKLRAWRDECRSLGRSFTSPSDNSLVISQLRPKLRELSTSHLGLFDPHEARSIWTEYESKDTGVRLRGINGRMIVYKVFPQSDAEEKSIKPGDVFLRWNDRVNFAADDVRGNSGVALIERGGERFEVELKAQALSIDESPRIFKLGQGVYHYVIPSFRSEYFEKDSWHEALELLKESESIVIDLRGNPGGDFLATLRFLSGLVCTTEEFGELSVFGEKSTELKDDSTTELIFEALRKNYNIKLRRLAEYPCLTQPLRVLVDRRTLSVSEIAAYVLKKRDNSLVMGELSGGEMLLSVWHHLSSFGPGYLISIPEAQYLSPQKNPIEGVGVSPDIALYYEYKDAVMGIDTWVNTALKDLTQSR